jgi:hypothetical protein
VPLVREALEGALGPAGVTLNADEAAALGAAWLAYFVAPGAHRERLRAMELFDALPRSVEVRGPGGALLGALPKGAPLALTAPDGTAAAVPVSLAAPEDDFVAALHAEGAGPFASFAVTGVAAARAAAAAARDPSAAPLEARVDLLLRVDRAGVAPPLPPVLNGHAASLPPY